MFAKNKKIISGVLIVVIVLLLSFAGYITLFSNSSTEETNLQTQKVKASTQTYTKTVVLNNQNTSSNSSVTNAPGSTLAPITSIPSPTQTVKAGIGGADINTTSPSPTEIILGYKNPPLSPTVGPSIDPTILAVTGANAAPSVTSTTDNSTVTGTATDSATTPSTTVAKLKSLPKTGLFQNTLIMFAVSSTLIFVAFLF